MTQNTTGTTVTLTVLVPDDLTAIDLLLHLKFAEALGISLIDCGWPKPAPRSGAVAA